MPGHNPPAPNTMTYYVTKINDKGSMTVSDEKPTVSRLGFTRKPGKRYQVPSLKRNAETTGNPLLIDAVRRYMDSITVELRQNGYATIDWITPTENIMMVRNDQGFMVPTETRWAEWDLPKLDDLISSVIQTMGAQQYTQPVQQVGGMGQAQPQQPVAGGFNPMSAGQYQQQWTGQPAAQLGS